MLFVKVECETADGGTLHGWGESGLSGRELAVKGAVEHYREFLLGSDAMNIGALWQEMYRSQYFEGGRALTAAISALDIALHDVKGKHLGVPVFQLLGGAHRHHCPSMCTVQGIDSVEETTLTLSAPLELNRNVHGTAFAGSLYSVGVLCAFYLGRAWMRREGLAVHGGGGLGAWAADRWERH